MRLLTAFLFLGLVGLWMRVLFLQDAMEVMDKRIQTLAQAAIYLKARVE